MKVVLVSNYLPDEQQSMLRYARLLEQQLNSRGIDVRIIYPPVRLTRLTGRQGALGKWAAYVDKYILAGSYLKREIASVDLVHICDHSNSMYLKYARGKASVITCHDLLAIFAAQGRFPGVRVGRTGGWLQKWIASGLRRAGHVLCVSHNTAAELRKLGDSNPSQDIEVVYHALNWPYYPVPADQTEAVLAAHGMAPQTEYVLHVGSNSWYKNRPAVVKIFASLRRDPRFARTRLLLAGKPWDRELSSAVETSGCAEAISDIGEVSNEELRALYSGARLFLFPSREEGFGWPILEAQACGCPVATTDRPPMTEVAGDAAILIDPDDPSASAQRILDALPALESLRASALANAAAFTPQRSIDGLLALYGRALSAAGLARMPG